MNEDLKETNPKFKKHNQRRTKEAQNNKNSKGTKRRVNITINGSLWDEIEKLDIGSKSKLVEDLIKEKLEKAKSV